jgi:hypothetical protein
MVKHWLGLDIIVRRHRDDDEYERESPETGKPVPSYAQLIDPHIHVEDDPDFKSRVQWTPYNGPAVDPSYRPEDQAGRAR